MLSESQLLGWFFLDHKKRVISFLSSEAAERYEQPGVFDELIRGAERPKCFLLRRRFHCGERDRLVDLASGRVGATGVCTADTMLGAAIRIAMRSAHMQRAQLISIYPLSSRLLILRFRGEASAAFADVADPRIGSTPVLLLQDGAVLRNESKSFAIGSLHVTAGVPHHLNGNAAACDRLSVDRARKIVDLHSVYHVPNVFQHNVSPLVECGSYHLVLGRKILENGVLVPLIVKCLSHFPEDVTAFVQNENDVVGILAGLHLRVDEFLVQRPTSCTLPVCPEIRG